MGGIFCVSDIEVLPLSENQLELQLHAFFVKKKLSTHIFVLIG